MGRRFFAARGAAGKSPVDLRYPPGAGTLWEAVVDSARAANDQIAEVGKTTFGVSTLGFLCECGDLGCDEIVSLTLAEYGKTTAGSVVGHHARQS